MPVSAQPPQRTSGIRPIVGGLPDVASPEEQYVPGGLPRTQLRVAEAQARAQRITEENRQYAMEQAETRRQEVLAQERAYFAGGLATREREAREAYEAERTITKQKVTEQVLFSLERRGLLARYGVGAVYGAELAPSKTYSVQAGKYSGTTLFKVKPSQIASADIPDQLKAYVEPQIEARFKQQDVLFEKNVSAWREESWTSYENYLASAFPPGIFLESKPAIPPKPTEQPSPGFVLPDIVGALSGFMEFLQQKREERYVAQYGQVGKILAKSEDVLQTSPVSQAYFGVGVVASGQAFTYSLASLAGIRGEVPSTWFSAIMSGKADMPVSYYAGTFVGDYLIGLGIGKGISAAWTAIGKYSHAAYVLSNIGSDIKGALPAFRGSSLDRWLLEHSEWYYRTTGGLIKQSILNVPSEGSRAFLEELGKFGGVNYLSVWKPGGEVAQRLGPKLFTQFLTPEEGLLSEVPTHVENKENLAKLQSTWRRMPSDYLSGYDINPLELALKYHIGAEMPSGYLGSYVNYELIVKDVQELLRSKSGQTTLQTMFQRPIAFAGSAIASFPYQEAGMRVAEFGKFILPSLIRAQIAYRFQSIHAPSTTAYAMMGKTAFMPKAPRWSFPSSLIREPIELPSLQRLPYTPEFSREGERTRKTLLVPTISRMARPRLEAPQRLRRIQEPYSALKPISRYATRQRARPIVEPYSALRVGPIQEAPQILKPVEEARQIQTPRVDFPAPTEVRSPLEVPRLRGYGGEFSPKKRKDKRRSMGSMWGKRAYPIMTGEEFMVKGLLGAKKK